MVHAGPKQLPGDWGKQPSMAIPDTFICTDI
jgi:hypothetical protein